MTNQDSAAHSDTYNLLTRHPALAKLWDSAKNRRKASQVSPLSDHLYWWRCRKGHEWEDSPRSLAEAETPCPYCRKWSPTAIRTFVESLIPHLSVLTPVELYTIYQQAGVLNSPQRRQMIINALQHPENLELATRALSQGIDDELNAVLEGNLTTPSGVVETPNPETPVEFGETNSKESDVFLPSEMELTSRPLTAAELPTQSVKDILTGFGAAIPYVTDDEAVEFLKAAAVNKIWAQAFEDEVGTLNQVRDSQNIAHTQPVKEQFWEEYEQVIQLRANLPKGYSFQIKGKFAPPNLMQLLSAVRLKRDRTLGNWSGTGAGKTVAACLGARHVEADFILICCPDVVIDGWERAIRQTFPDSQVERKTLCPNWQREEEGRNVPRYLIINYEMLQQPWSEAAFLRLLEETPADMLVVDEIHFVKHRFDETSEMSKRRRLLQKGIDNVRKQKPLYVIGMTATPIINNLSEAKSLIELVQGRDYPELGTRLTIPNCIRTHQILTTIGIRWKPNYENHFGGVEHEINWVDCGSALPVIEDLPRGHIGKLEQVLAEVKIRAMLPKIRPKTLIYSHYVEGIHKPVRDLLSQQGWTTGLYNGDTREGLSQFIDGDIDVLICSKAIATGIDRLQEVCNRLILLVPPWTAAELEQLIGRIWRQGQSHPVHLIIPATFANISGERWSWCESRLERLRFKASLTDCALDGVLPDESLRSPKQAYQDAMKWLDRLKREEGENRRTA